MDLLTHQRSGHEYNIFEWNELLKYTIFSKVWPLSTLPTLLYTCQYYDMLETAVNPNGTPLSFWIRTGCIVFIALGTVLATVFQDYCSVLYTWYYEPFGGHYDQELWTYFWTYRILHIILSYASCAYAALDLQDYSVAQYTGCAR